MIKSKNRLSFSVRIQNRPFCLSLHGLTKDNRGMRAEVRKKGELINLENEQNLQTKSSKVDTFPENWQGLRLLIGCLRKI